MPNAMPSTYQQITQDAVTPSGLTVPPGANSADVIPEGAIRYLTDGSSLTAARGMPLVANQPRTFSAGELATLKLISQAGSVKINVDYQFS